MLLPFFYLVLHHINVEEIYFGALYNNLKRIKFCILLFQVLFIGSFTAGSSEDDQQDKSSIRTIFVSFLHIQFTMNYYFSNQIIQYKELHNQVISILLLLPLCGVLTFLLLWHIYLILQNKTTIEVCASDVIVISRFVATFLGCLTTSYVLFLIVSWRCQRYIGTIL